MSNCKLTKEAMDAWDRVNDKDGARLWHLLYTPWFSLEEIEAIVSLYEKKIVDPKPEDMKPEETKFEKLWKKGK